MRVPLIELDLRMPMDGLKFDRILFLDIDGVLHPDGPGDYADFSCLPRFCDVLRAADPAGVVPIVISSAWRHTQRLEDIKRNFPKDISLRIVGVTPDVLQTNASWMVSDALLDGASVSTHKRQSEIMAWICRNAPAGRWLALDDRASGFEGHCRHLFLVPGTTKDGGGPGITALIAIDFRKRLDQFLRPGEG